MMSFVRTIAAFALMLVAGYVVMVAVLPAPTSANGRPDEMTGASAAARLSQEAQILVGRKPAATLQ